MSKTVQPLLIGDTISGKDLTKDQKNAFAIYMDWKNSKKSTKNQVLRIGGVAGTGKTTLLKYIIGASKLDSKNCIVASYTGQAVNVLRRSGVLSKTLHSTFMTAKEEPLIKDGKIVKHRGIPVTITKWVPVKHIPSAVKLIIIDEASFLSEQFEKQICSYGCPVLELGDPVQLPPVTGKQCFRFDNLDYFMTQVMRQNESSEIYQLSQIIRNGDSIRNHMFTKEVRVLLEQDTIEDTFFQFFPYFKHADMIITATNKQRQNIVDLYRKHIISTTSPYPIKGEPLICRKNAWSMTIGQYPLTNGTIGTAKHTVARSSVDSSNGVYYIDFQPNFIDNDYYDNLMCDASFLLESFGPDKYNKKFYSPGHKLEYAHAITVYSSQGAQAERVLYMDSYFKGDDEYRMRTRYTAVTRAMSRLYYVTTQFS